MAHKTIRVPSPGFMGRVAFIKENSASKIFSFRCKARDGFASIKQTLGLEIFPSNNKCVQPSALVNNSECTLGYFFISNNLYLFFFCPYSHQGKTPVKFYQCILCVQFTKKQNHMIGLVLE